MLKETRKKQKEGLSVWRRGCSLALAGTMALSGMMTLTGCGDDSSQADIRDEQEDVKKDAKADTPQSFTIGDTVDMDPVRVKLESVTFADKEEYGTPDEGNRFMYAELTIENIQEDEKLSVSPSDWKVEDSNGLVVEYDMMSVSGKKEIPYADLKAGGKVTGTISFQVPKDDAKLKLQYYANMFDDKPLFEFEIDGTAK